MSFNKKEEKYIIAPDYEITFCPLLDKNFEKLPRETKDRINEVFNITRHKPAQVIPLLINLKKEFPEIPKIYNYLYNAYIMTNNITEAENIAEENFKKNPDYLYAKINYAYFMLKRNGTEFIPAIFNNKFDLKELYPNRKTFHISEFAGFSEFLSQYYLKIKKTREAEKIMNEMIKIAPRHNLTRVIKKRVMLALNKKDR